MALLISSLLSESIFDFGKCSNRKYANTQMAVICTLYLAMPPRDLAVLHNINYLLLCVMYRMSHVMCHKSHVICHKSHVRSHVNFHQKIHLKNIYIKIEIKDYFDKLVELVVWGSVINET